MDTVQVTPIKAVTTYVCVFYNLQYNNIDIYDVHIHCILDVDVPRMSVYVIIRMHEKTENRNSRCKLFNCVSFGNEPNPIFN